MLHYWLRWRQSWCVQTTGIWNGWMRLHFCKLLKDALTFKHACSGPLVTHRSVWCDQDRMFNGLPSWNLMNSSSCSIAYVLLQAFVINILLWDVLFYFWLIIFLNYTEVWVLRLWIWYCFLGILKNTCWLGSGEVFRAGV